jgi:hypothetical protein
MCFVVVTIQTSEEAGEVGGGGGGTNKLIEFIFQPTRAYKYTAIKNYFKKFPNARGQILLRDIQLTHVQRSEVQL